MSEPILHMTEKKDSLDIMYEMDMKELLLHPAIVELLNLVYEGKYSVSSSSLNISPTFVALLQMEMGGSKRIQDSLIDNIATFGDNGGSIQTSLQYNIWKQSIQQREQDEMFFTVLVNMLILLMATLIIMARNESLSLMKDTFQGTIQGKIQLILNAKQETLAKYCEQEIDLLLYEHRLMSALTVILIFNTLGMLSSVIQKLLTYRLRDNVSIPFTNLLLESSIAAVGIIYIVAWNNTDFNPLIFENCSTAIDIPAEKEYAINKIFTLRYPKDGQIRMKLLISVIVI